MARKSTRRRSGIGASSAPLHSRWICSRPDNGRRTRLADLPEEAREALVSLMTRLILEHAGATATPTTKLEADHDQ